MRTRLKAAEKRQRVVLACVDRTSQPTMAIGKKKMSRTSERNEHETVASSQWLVVLNANGVVESLEGDAPATWLGQVLTDVPGTPGILRQAAADLILGPPTSYVRRRRVRCVDDQRAVDVEVLLVEALPLHRAPTRIHELVMRMMELFASQAKSNKIDLTIEQDDDVPATFVLDGEKIAWALSTLVVNALRYARAHVGVHVSTDDQTNDLVIKVSDDGAGIPEDKERWLFERDPTSGHASGLALPMVRDVMAAHRGSVTLHRNSAARRTTFTLRIPRVPFR
jgi:hypothetical protein